MRATLLTSLLLFAAAAAATPAGLPAPDRLAQAESTPTVAEPRYGTLRLVRPAPAETIHDNSGTVPVEVTLQPALRAEAGHRFRVLLDNALQPGAWATTRFSLPQVDRGAHTLQVIVTDRGGDELARSAPVEFHMWQASRLFPGRRAAP